MIKLLSRKDIRDLKWWISWHRLEEFRSSVDFHIDPGNLGTIKQKDWIDKALYFFLVACIVNQHLSLPWEFMLVYPLKYRRKLKNINFADRNSFFRDMHRYTPPSIYWTNKKLLATFVNNVKSIFSNKFEVNLSEIYIESDRNYFRSLSIATSRKNIFKIILSEIFDKRIFKLNLNTLEDKVNLKRIEKLKLELEKDPKNIDLVVELSILTFLASDLKEALVYLDSFKKKYPNNGEVYFWKAILTYYCDCQVSKKTRCKHLKKAKSLLESGIKADPSNAECLSFLFRLVWRETKSFEKAIKYMKKVKEIAPDWITPRIQLARYYLYEFHELKNKKALELLKKELEELSFVDWKKFGGKKSFREKYLTAYFTGKTRENRAIVLELMRWYYGIKKFDVKNLSKEDKKFLKRAGLRFKILDE